MSVCVCSDGKDFHNLVLEEVWTLAEEGFPPTGEEAQLEFPRQLIKAVLFDESSQLKEEVE